jgi:hypothetical protein
LLGQENKNEKTAANRILYRILRETRGQKYGTSFMLFMLKSMHFFNRVGCSFPCINVPKIENTEKIVNTSKYIVKHNEFFKSYMD